MTKPATAKRRAEAPVNDDNLLERLLKESHQPGTQAAPSPKGTRVSLRQAGEIAFSTSSDYLLKGLISPGDLSVWFGPSGCGKTFAALDIAAAVASGDKKVWFERRVRKANVALFSLEGSAAFGKRLAAIRSEAILQKRKLDLRGLFVHAQPLALFENADDLAGEVIDAIRACEARLAIFDTLSRAMNGANENAAEDMTLMVGVFDRIRAETGAHVMLIHHTGKDEERGSRGHSSLRGAADTEVQFSRDASGVRIATITKSRDDIDNWKFAFKLKPVPLGLDDDKDQVTSCVVEETAVPVKTKASELSARDQKILRLVGDMMNGSGRALKIDVAKRASQDFAWKMDTAQKVIRDAIKDGLLETDRSYVWPAEKPM